MNACFISDLHLGSKSGTDSDRRERIVVDFLRSIQGNIDKLYLVGDILDYWFEYRTVVPRGYVRFFGQLAAMADAGIEITWLIGNHDIWLFDYLRDELGIRVIDGSITEDIMGKRFFISHGDGLGKLPRGFKIIRGVFRNRLCQRMYASIHPRWTVPFALRWSASSRASEQPAHFENPSDDPLRCFSLEQLAIDPTINYFVYGHRHELLDTPLSPTSRMIILGDWIDKFSYGLFDGEVFKLCRYEVKQ